MKDTTYKRHNKQTPVPYYILVMIRKMESVNVIARQVEPLAQNIRTVQSLNLTKVPASLFCCFWLRIWHSMRLQYNNGFAKFTPLKQKLVKFFISFAVQVHYTDVPNVNFNNILIM